jgi:hypothetical protein
MGWAEGFGCEGNIRKKNKKREKKRASFFSGFFQVLK